MISTKVVSDTPELGINISAVLQYRTIQYNTVEYSAIQYNNRVDVRGHAYVFGLTQEGSKLTYAQEHQLPFYYNYFKSGRKNITVDRRLAGKHFSHAKHSR